jgi:asparaginyl-tRNA synthetase
MMTTKTKTTIHKIGNFVGQEVTLQGWLANSRSSGSVQFLMIRDGTGFIQGIVAKNELLPEVFQLAHSLNQESSLEVTGIVREEKRAPGGYELTIKNLKLIGSSENYPITPKEHGIDFLMENRHLWFRSQRQQAILKIRHEIIKAIRDYLDSQGFVLVDAPILTPSACEGTTNLFEVQYFEDKAYLTQSGQLYMEAAAMALGKVYCFGPTFRAEKSKTRRHLTEFWMVEPEMAFCHLEDSLQTQEGMVSFIVSRVLENRKKELEYLKRDISKLEKIIPPFPRISYDESLEILKKKGLNPVWGNDFGGTDETILTEQFEKPIFVTHFPMACKAFYMKQDPVRPELAVCADLLAPEGYGEIIGGGQREEDLGLLEARMERMKMEKEPYQWYLDLRRFGTVPHGGFGLGIERTVSWICGLEHVREAIPFARTLYRIYP